jgi:hypothetical protein
MAIRAQSYLCWGADHEDLTASVERAKRTKPDWGSLRATVNADPNASFDRVQRIIVYCSTGHKNVYSFTR